MTESETRRARKDWQRRNSDMKAENQPQANRFVEEEEVVIPDGQLGEGTTVTFERHTHDWSVDNPDE